MANRKTPASSADPLREILHDLVTEVRDRRAQLLAALTYVVLASGGLFLFSSIGEDSGDAYDTVARTTLAGVSIGILSAGVLLGALTLAVDAGVRRRVRPGALRRHVQHRIWMVMAMTAGVALIATGSWALTRWS
jgi:hypothetical protein